LLWRIGCLSLVCLLACSSTESPQALPALTLAQLRDPTNCKDCHPKQYAEWSSSMHAYATKDPVFQAMNKRGQGETGGELGPFCVKCHAPMAVVDNVITDYTNLDSIPPQLQGVTCYFCHNATGVMSDHSNANITIANDTTMRAAISGAQFPSTHKVQHSSNHDHNKLDSSIMCGTCHDIVNQSGFHLERTLAEYQSTFFSDPANPASFQTCQSCHMDKADNQELVAQKSGYPGVTTHVRDVHSHLFPGVDLPLTEFPGGDVMRRAVEDCKLPISITYFTVDPNPPGARFTVNLETQAGHAQPSGASQDRRMWLEVTGYDANGTVVYQSPQVGDADLESTAAKPQPCLMRDYTLDASGNEALMFWNATSLDTSRGDQPIPLPNQPQKGTHTRICKFPAPGISIISRLQFKLRMRPVGMDVLQDLVASGHLSPDVVAKVPILTVQTRNVHFDQPTSQYVVDDTLLDDGTPPDCVTYKCMLDPDGQDCSAARAAVSGNASKAGVGGTPVVSAGAGAAPLAAATAGSGGVAAAGAAGSTSAPTAGTAGAAAAPVAGGPARD
jgi:hypothetical protein